MENSAKRKIQQQEVTYINIKHPSRMAESLNLLLTTLKYGLDICSLKYVMYMAMSRAVSKDNFKV